MYPGFQTGPGYQNRQKKSLQLAWNSAEGWVSQRKTYPIGSSWRTRRRIHFLLDQGYEMCPGFQNGLGCQSRLGKSLQLA
jgi:outer membrane cobalamin receptor